MEQANRAEREAAQKMLQEVIDEAGRALDRNAQALAAYGKALNPTSPPPPNLQYVDLKGIDELMRAAHDYKTPFPPDHLAEKWAAFKAKQNGRY
jgi:hypothetical protein